MKNKNTKVEAVDKRRKFYVTVLVVIAILIVVSDLYLFWSSLQEEGVGSGLSRYWS